MKAQKQTPRRRIKPETDYHLAQAAMKLLNEGFDYRQSIEAFRLKLLDKALSETKNVKSQAAKRLGISRVHFTMYLQRGKERA